ncbi:MAG TPA: hypothetical protein VGC80_02945, partial [Acetobacteraceae bacterium]
EALAQQILNEFDPTTGRIVEEGPVADILRSAPHCRETVPDPRHPAPAAWRAACACPTMPLPSRNAPVASGSVVAAP